MLHFSLSATSIILQRPWVFYNQILLFNPNYTANARLLCCAMQQTPDFYASKCKCHCLAMQNAFCHISQERNIKAKAISPILVLPRSSIINSQTNIFSTHPQCHPGPLCPLSSLTDSNRLREVAKLNNVLAYTDAT